MNKKVLNYSKKTMAIIIVLLIMFMPTIANAAYSYTPSSTKNVTDILNSRYNNIKQYKKYYEDMTSFTQGIDKNISVDDAKIQIIDKVTQMQDDYSEVPAISTGSSKLLNSVITSDATNTSDLLSSVLSTLKSALNNNSLAIQSLTPDQVVQIKAETAGKRAGNEYNVNLSGNVYLNSTKSNKWVLLLHGNNMTGQAITDAIGDMYIEQGFNIFAPDLRGAGKSEGSVAMGYLESLDAWDWLTYLNSNYTCDEIIVHGVSLGGATTVQLSGLSVDGKTLKQQNVIGLVEDCGYTSMTGIITGMLGMDDTSSATSQNKTSEALTSKILGISDKTNLSGVLNGNTILKTLLTTVGNTGLTDENFDELQNGLNSLANCELPLLIIHGDSDSIVPYDNSNKIYDAAMANDKIPYVQRFTASGEQHAFIVLGSKYNVYEGHVENFIKTAETVKNGTKVNKVSDYKEEAEQKTSVITSLVKALKLLKNMIGI